jgi:diguanylate cyclase (GGDEF)-like protein
MNDQTLEPQQSGDMMQQVVRRSPMLGSLLGALAHTAVCWLALQLDFFRGGEDLFYKIIALVWSGYLVFGAVFLLGLNRSLRDPSMVLPIMVWSTLSLLLTAYYIDQVRLCVMVMFFAILQPGVFRLELRAFIGLAVMCVVLYALIIWRVGMMHPEALDVTAEFIQWMVFAVITGGVVMVAAEISTIRTRISTRNRELSKFVADMETMATTDGLTGVLNRRHVMERLIKIREMAKRNAFSFVVVYVDLDFFKQVNDNYGHHVGDDVLKGFSKLMQETVTEGDLVARLGGEEFLLVLVNADMHAAMPVIESLREATTGLRFDSAPALRISVSMGAAEFSAGESLDHLLARADDALYTAKETGRNRVCVAAEVRDES